jgi:predicted ester cyclase
MSAIDIVKEGLAAIEAGDFKKAESLVADDFVFAGPTPQPLGKREFIGTQMAMHKAFPDWRFNATDFKENGEEVTTMMQITGTQTGELSLPMPGFQTIPPSGKKISLPKEPTTLIVKNGKLASLKASVSADGGVPGILKQLGVKMP